MKNPENGVRIEWKLIRTIFHNMFEYFKYYPEIDFFESRLNAQLRRFFSYRPNPFSEVKNAFSVSLEDKTIWNRQDITKKVCR